MNEPLSVAWQFVSIVLATFVSEDLTCIATGLLIHEGRVLGVVGLAAAGLGIYLGDLGLWAVGRWGGRGILRWPLFRRRLSSERIAQLGAWFDRDGWRVVLAARCVPGLRLPVYLAAGVLGRNARPFLLWSLAASLVWTPALVLSVALLGRTIVGPLEYWLGQGWLALTVACCAAFVLLHVLLAIAGGLATPVGRSQLAARVALLWQWEFWPTWLFYLPLVPWLAWLSLRYRSCTVWTAANPGIPQGGVVGESKYEILAQLPERWCAPTVLVPAGDLRDRWQVVEAALGEGKLRFPIILKPDAGQRGAGVRRALSRVEAAAYLADNPLDALAQEYHPGPFEAGIFYYRLPNEPRGRIFSITDKQFPRLVGDGVSTVQELIWRHPRYRMQAQMFLARHAAQRQTVLAAGEELRLALAGNHSQGTMFLEGGQLWTPALEARIDQIAHSFPGFYFGRFDVRYRDRDAFCAGQDLTIVELNGVTSESTNIYDPRRSLCSAYVTLARQWSLAYSIGHANRRRGQQPDSLWSLWEQLREYQATQISSLAD